MISTKKNSNTQKKQPPLTTAQVNELIRRYNNKEQQTDVAKEMKINLQTVRYRYDLLDAERMRKRDRVFNAVLRRKV